MQDTVMISRDNSSFATFSRAMVKKESKCDLGFVKVAAKASDASKEHGEIIHRWT